MDKVIHNFKDESSKIISDTLFESEYYYNDSTINSSKGKFKVIDYNARIIVKRLIGFFRNKTSIEVQKFGIFNKKEILDKVNNLNKVNNFEYKYRVESHSLNSVKITKII